MNNPGLKFPGLRGLAALSLSIVVAVMPVFRSTASSMPATAQEDRLQKEVLQRNTTISSVVAIASPQGVLLRWKTSFELDNVGFNVYRERAGQRTRVNREIIPGSTFIVGQNVSLRAGYSYSWLDANGTADSLYSIEAIGLDGTTRNSDKIAPRRKDILQVEGQSVDSNKLASTTQREYPAASSQPITADGTLDDQWAIASQAGLKIAIKKDAWYRVTQQQMVSAGFNPVVDIGNLRLFRGARELAIRTNRPGGQFVDGDYIEFYGQGLDTPTTDSNIYYLLAGTTAGKRIATAGKRVRDSVRSESDSLPSLPPQAISLPPLELNSNQWFWWLSPPIGDSATQAIKTAATTTPTTTAATTTTSEISGNTPGAPEAVIPSLSSTSSAQASEPASVDEGGSSKPSANELKTELARPAASPAKSVPRSKTRKTRKRKYLKRKYAHAVAPATLAGSAQNFVYTVERKERLVYFSSLINGDAENYFGAVISSPALGDTTDHHVDQSLTTLNPDLSGNGTVHLEIALQGVNFTNHVVNVQLNGASVGTINFSGVEHRVQPFDVSVSQLRSGVCDAQNSNCNIVRLIPSPNTGLSIVDYVRLTYPRSFSADNGSLRFTLGPTDSATIDGFNSSSIRLIDYTDPFAVRVTQPRTQSNGSGFSFDVPAATGPERVRTLLAIPESDADQSAVLSLNQSSNLNLATNGADLLIIAHRTLMPSVDPLKNLRNSQGLQVAVVDVEDIYDEFSYGRHGPQAIRDFLLWASTHWTRVPRYIILAGDASSDPRNYLGYGNFDFVPTKLVDATYQETASDDWLVDFDNDGAADIPVGRLPVRNAAEANVVISKIVNFLPANTPQSALLVADTQGSYYFNFEQANTEVQSLLPAGMTAQRVDRRLEPSDAQAKADIITKFNAGLALVNYSGHGNVDTWTGGGIFTSSDAMALTNGNKLPFVVVMDCLNGYFQDPALQGIAEALMKAPNGGAVAAFASSGSTIPDGQHAMSRQLYTTLYGSQPIALGDAIKIAKGATFDIDVRHTWVFFGDPSMKIR